MVEFIVEGRPRSLQTSNTSRETWKAAVRGAAQAAMDGIDRMDLVDVSVRIVRFCANWGDTSGDLDNIAKPILDGMQMTVFFNDNQVTQLHLRRTDFEKSGLREVVGAGTRLTTRIDRALASGEDRDFVYISVDDRAIDHSRIS